MSRWRIWWRAGLGDPPSEELVAAAGGLDGRTLRRVRRLVRQGRAADNAASARFAVALAREHQRRWAASSSPRVAIAVTAMTSAIVGGLAILAVTRSNAGGTATGSLLSGYLGYVAWRIPRQRSAAKNAERVNRDFLNGVGKPYVPGGRPAGVQVHPLVVVGSFVLWLTLYLPIVGSLMVVSGGEQLTPGGVISRGMPVAVGATIGIVLGAQRRKRRLIEQFSQ